MTNVNANTKHSIKNILRFGVLPLVLLCAVFATAPAYAAKTTGDISISKARMVEGQNCVSMTLTNNGTMIDALLSAKTTAAKTVVLVDQRMHHDVVKIELMPKIPLEIEAGKACIILRDFIAPPKVGDKFTLTLTFEHAGTADVTVDVIAPDVSKPENKNTPKKPAPKKSDEPKSEEAE